VDKECKLLDIAMVADDPRPLGRGLLWSIVLHCVEDEKIFGDIESGILIWLARF
jgi:hypothetical protein